MIDPNKVSNLHQHPLLHKRKRWHIEVRKTYKTRCCQAGIIQEHRKHPLPAGTNSRLKSRRNPSFKPKKNSLKNISLTKSWRHHRKQPNEKSIRILDTMPTQAPKHRRISNSINRPPQLSELSSQRLLMLHISGLRCDKRIAGPKLQSLGQKRSRMRNETGVSTCLSKRRRH